jgi:hypothetical protein
MVYLRGREGQKSVGDSTDDIPVRFEGCIGVFDDGFVGRGNACDETFVIHGESNAGRDGAVAKFKESKEKAGQGEHSVTFSVEGADAIAVGIPSAGSEACAARETEGPSKSAAVVKGLAVADAKEGGGSGHEIDDGKREEVQVQGSK